MTQGRILIVTDAWAPQMNGVVRTLQATVEQLRARGREVHLLSPQGFRSFPCPTYPEIRLALATTRRVAAAIDAIKPDAIHIATEGPLGLAARRWCIAHRARFTTAYHTQFPDYVAARTRLPAALFWRYIRWFHAPAHHILVSTESVRQQLAQHGLENSVPWSRGVDLSLFHPDQPASVLLADLPRPIQLYVGRIAVEKNIAAFLVTPYPGTKVVVGDGPLLTSLRAEYPDVLFLGKRGGAELASLYAGADVMVFPSRTDTFGLVMIEAMACGTPVAAYPVSGPRDVVPEQGGALRHDLSGAIRAALTLDRTGVARCGADYSWAAATDQFVGALVDAFPQADVIPMRAA